jgi:hypothetical protein
MGPAFLAGLGDPGLHAIAQNIAFELSVMRRTA